MEGLNFNYKIDAAPAKRLLEEAPRAFHQALDRGMAAGVLMLEGDVERNIGTPYEGKPAAVAFGTLVNHIFGEVVDHELDVSGFVGIAPPADVYGAAVETGTRPHFPPVDALIPWVKKKFDVKNESQARSIAYCIARKIAQRGTVGHFMFQRAFDTDEAKIGAIFEAETASALAALEGGR